ncbi:MAG TPA: 4'-phosphopantetheinyl transferase superfamily protein [Solirubrobacteraceae bacterium]|jgi:4'-phosphopantetheinyl transferase EntD
MFEKILPEPVAIVETRGDIEVELFPEEELAVGMAVPKRRREFTTARACAREALHKLGLPAAPITKGERGEPQWPTGVVGSITHCDRYRACAVAHAHSVLALGIDADCNAPLPVGLISDIARPEELPTLRRCASELPDINWDRLLFSAKESVYKAWFPLAHRWLGFEDAIVEIDPETGTFLVRLLVEGPSLTGALHGCSQDGSLATSTSATGASLQGFVGRWIVHDGIVATAIALMPAMAADHSA